MSNNGHVLYVVIYMPRNYTCLSFIIKQLSNERQVHSRVRWVIILIIMLVVYYLPQTRR